MTYQSSPMYPIIFPDQAAALNPYGYQPAPGNLVVVKHLLPAGHDAHVSWKKEADKLAMAKVLNTKLSERSMLQGPPSRKGSHYTTTRGPAGHPLKGGTVWTQQGERMVGDLLRDRKAQLDAVHTASFEEVSPERLSDVTPEVETFKLDKMFADVLSSLGEGLVEINLSSTLNTAGEILATQAEKIPERKFAEYLGTLDEIDALISDMLNRPNVRQGLLPKQRERRDAVLYELANIVDRIAEFIRVFMNYLGSPTKKKKAVLEGLRNSFLGSVRQSIFPKVVEANAEIYRAPQPEVGEQGAGRRKRY